MTPAFWRIDSAIRRRQQEVCFLPGQVGTLEFRGLRTWFRGRGYGLEWVFDPERGFDILLIEKLPEGHKSCPLA